MTDPARLRFAESSHGPWSQTDLGLLLSADGADFLYQMLVDAQEVAPVDDGPDADDDDPGAAWLSPATAEALAHRVPRGASSSSADLSSLAAELVARQRRLASRVPRRSRFSVSLFQRLTVLKRVFFALHHRYHKKLRVLGITKLLSF